MNDRRVVPQPSVLTGEVQQLHEEMSKRLHTFDTEGNLIWVDELKPDRLPRRGWCRLVESFSYAVKKDPKLTGTLGRDRSPAAAAQATWPVAGE
eukprot:Skav209975  [mRNA]  locus=scaffold3013:108233:110655:- [translate_table: standard]